jgi:hypothetical protein
MVLNVSRGGLFVQTSAGPPPGADVTVDLDVAGASAAVAVGGKVIWRRVVAPHLRTISQGGVGVRIETAPEAYYSFLSGVAGEGPGPRPAVGGESAGAPLEPGPDAPQFAFRIRVKKAGGPRSRTLTLHAESEERAHDRALAIAGAGWTILELERCS